MYNRAKWSKEPIVYISPVHKRADSSYEPSTQKCLLLIRADCSSNVLLHRIKNKRQMFKEPIAYKNWMLKRGDYSQEPLGTCLKEPIAHKSLLFVGMAAFLLYRPFCIASQLNWAHLSWHWLPLGKYSRIYLCAWNIFLRLTALDTAPRSGHDPPIALKSQVLKRDDCS